MTGKPFYKTRVITSERLVSPLVGRRDLNDAAIAFKKAVVESKPLMLPLVMKHTRTLMGRKEPTRAELLG